MSEQNKELMAQIKRLIAQRDAYEEALNKIIAVLDGQNVFPADHPLRVGSDSADFSTIRKIAADSLKKWGDL